eukprot:1788121-Rhodomonas_salina.1
MLASERNNARASRVQRCTAHEMHNADNVMDNAFHEMEAPHYSAPQPCTWSPQSLSPPSPLAAIPPCAESVHGMVPHVHTAIKYKDTWAPTTRTPSVGVVVPSAW